MIKYYLNYVHTQGKHTHTFIRGICHAQSKLRIQIRLVHPSDPVLYLELELDGHPFYIGAET